MVTSANFLEVRNLSHSYPQGDEVINVLQDVSFLARKSDFVSILGPSGCGKTTLLNLVGGLEKPAKGSISVDGIDLAKLDVSRLGRFRRDMVSFIFQFFNLFPSLTALENVELGLELLPLSRQEVRKRAIHYLDAVGLAKKADRLPAHLSGGEQQRVAIARALAKQTRLILADEPTGNLDQASGRTVMDLLEEISRTTETCILMITHDENLATRARNVLRLRDGRLVESV